jgi:hypothetical protein
MPIELIVHIEDGATKEQIKEIAKEIFLSPFVIGVYRPAAAPPPGVQVTHHAPGKTQ